ncbi:MAG: hypothetical protein ABI639_16195 [Thermoanaerobaculia bacterium]
MSHYTPAWAPASTLPADRRGAVVGRFCRECSSFYPLYSAAHKGKPSFGRDHVSSTCACEGRSFDEGASWWEPAVAVLVPKPSPATVASPAAG